MSDPVTNMEIEDVLSSIRRLVAEGDKAKQEKKREYGDAPEEADRFVLTPALRISQENAEESLVTDETVVAGESAFVAEKPAEEELEAQSASLKDVFVGEPHSVPEDPIQAEPEFDEAEQSVEVPVSEAETSRESLEATIAALEAAVTGSTEEFEPDGSEVKPTSSWADEDPVVFDSIRNDAEHKMAPLELTPADAVVEEDYEDPGVDALLDETSEKLEMLATSSALADVELETSVEAEAEKASNDQQESVPELKPEAEGRVFRVVPDHPPEEVDRPEPAAAPSAASVAAQAAMYHGSEAVEEEDHGDEMIADDPKFPAADDDIERMLLDRNLIEEEVLKKLVADVVKGELEGKLGETITRNVRRLVRREINRVLTHQELE